VFRSTFISVLFFLLFTFCSYAQEDDVSVKSKDTVFAPVNTYNALSPSKAAFFSAIFPGGGQIYNKKYWKAPIVWAALGTSTYLYLDNNSQYKRYRRAFKQRKAGIQDEFTLDNGSILLSDAGLERAQKTLRGNRDLSILSTVLIYVLQIIEASVNAHLLQFDTGNNISINPMMIPDPIIVETPTLGLRLKYSF
tara:strand:+ start:14319 stop:14900 length:582 start_codon:yes stop_codon:yes gene_type:complete